MGLIIFGVLIVNIENETWKMIVSVGGAGLGFLFLVARLFRGEMSGQKDDAAKGDVIASLRAELKRKDDEIIAKEITISRLVKEKADQLTQLSEIPYLRDEIKELEEQVRALAQLLNVFIVGGNGLTPEQQLVMLRLLSPSAQPKSENPKDES